MLAHGATCMPVLLSRAALALAAVVYCRARPAFRGDVSRERLKRSSLLARLRLFAGTGGIVLIGAATVSIRGCTQTKKSSPDARSRDAPIGRIIVLNCYGRGGSGIVWRMIGSSPDVIMTSEEWHVGVFGSRKSLRKGLLLAFRSLGIQIVRAVAALCAQEDARNAEAERRDH